MKRLFTALNCFIIVLSFFAGLLIMDYEQRNGILTVAERKLTNEIKQEPILLGEGSININSASKEELSTLHGIGDKLSERIIDYRTENGGFNTCEDIMKVSGIGKKMFDSIKDYICVGEEEEKNYENSCG